MDPALREPFGWSCPTRPGTVPVLRGFLRTVRGPALPARTVGVPALGVPGPREVCLKDEPALGRLRRRRRLWASEDEERGGMWGWGAGEGAVVAGRLAGDGRRAVWA